MPRCRKAHQSPSVCRPPRSKSPSHPSEQHEIGTSRASPSDAAGDHDGSDAAAEAMQDSASGSPAGDSSGDDEAPLASMRSQDESAAAQGSGSAQAPAQQQQQAAEQRTERAGTQIEHR